MKKLISLLILIPALISAQYYGERSTEQSFEKSELFFKSHYLNTFGLKNFGTVALGLSKDPFLKVYLNPALIPEFSENTSSIFYLDFRGDRTEEEFVTGYVVPNYYRSASYYDMMPYIDRRWITVSRTEPEPTFSFGFLINPIPELDKNFYLGATYQMIKRDEKYYSSPYYIYRSSAYYDSFGGKVANEAMASVPIEDRYSGQDEMVTEGHLFSFYTGYRINDKLSVGLSYNGVIHARDGGYQNSRSDEYGQTNFTEWENVNRQTKNQDYNHSDFSLGVMYQLTEKFNAGIKAGILSGKAEQEYNSIYKYMYKRDASPTDESYYNNSSNSSTEQRWIHDGTNKYFGLNFDFTPSPGNLVRGYYRYTNGKEDLTNSSSIRDTSYYVSHWVSTYNNVKNVGDYTSTSSAKDLRSGTGETKKIEHELMLSYNTKLTDWSNLTVGLFVNVFNNDISNWEPVLAQRYSESHSKHTGSSNYNYDYLTRLDEIKKLYWVYSSDYWSIQVPVQFDFTITDFFGCSLGINRMMKNWNISETTIAYFDSRKRNENGVIKEEKNFGERYKPADEKVTENETDMYFKMHANINKNFRINLLLDPEFKSLMRISQWWLSFEARF